MKVKLFTHDDLDGIGCAIVAKYAFEDVDVEYCSNSEINDKVRDFTASMQFTKYDKVYITDISVNKEVAELIEYSISESREYINRYQLIDHHNTAKWLNDYKWAFVDDMEPSLYSSIEKMKSSGTSLFYNHLWEKELIYETSLLSFIEEVRRYDTWEWTTKMNGIHAKQLNDLLYIIGREKFINRFIYDSNVYFSDTEKVILEIEQERIDKYISLKKEQMLIDQLEEYSVGVTFAEQYQSQLGNELANSNPHLDFIIMIDVGQGKISYRNIHDRIDLGKIVKRYGGGGHPKAAGSQTDDSVRLDSWLDYVITYK